MSYIRNLFHQSSYYFAGNVLVVLAGFISFPIWTRYFSKDDYGIFSIIITSISFLVVFSKLGLPHAALRFYSEFKEGKRELDPNCYYSTIFLSSLCISGLIILTIFSVTEFLILGYVSVNEKIIKLLPLIAIIVFLTSITSVLTEFVRAEERGKLYSIIQVAIRYGRLIITLLFVFGFVGGLYGFFWGYAVTEALNVAILLSLLIAQKKIRIKNFSSSFLKKSIKYGFPLIWFELSNMILSMGDRYLIQFYMGEKAVGVYSAGYNLSDMAQSVISMPLRLAVIPMYLGIWSRDGEDKTKDFLTRSFSYYFMFGIPIIFGMSWFGKEIITLVASSKFQEAHIIIPYIIFPMVVNGALPIYGAGLYIQKKSKVLMYLTFMAGAVNILLNIILIPLYGIMGAAYATLAAYFFLAIMIVVSSYRYLGFRVEISSILRYSVLSVIIMYILSMYSAESMDRMLVKIMIGTVLYFIAVLLTDRNLRMKSISIIKNR